MRRQIKCLGPPKQARKRIHYSAISPSGGAIIVVPHPMT